MVMNLSEKLTIVIPCKNEGFTVKKSLDLLNLQSNIENVLILVSDFSDDFTKNLLSERKSDKFNLKLTLGGLPSVARNNGAKFCKTPYILFLDADMFILDENFLSEIITEMENKDFDLLTCRFNTKNGKYNNLYNLFFTFQKITKWVSPFALGGFMLFKTTKFKELGGFDENRKVAEDYQISRKIKPKKFGLYKKNIFTETRRFDKKGLFYMLKLFINSFLYRNNKEYFTDDHCYWV
jgi:glycosyltransferase involved in cell wall biosynthesis